MSASLDHDSVNIHSFVSHYYYTVCGIGLIVLVIILQRYMAQQSMNNNNTNGKSDNTTTQQPTTAAAARSINTEGKRRIQHGMTGCILVLISYCIPISLCIVLLCIATYIIYYLKTYHFHTIYLPNFGPLLRDYEKQPPPTTQSSSSSSNPNADNISQIPLPGAFYFLLGTTITAILFPIHVARYSVLCLSLADPMAAYVGQLIPSRRLDQIIIHSPLPIQNVRIVTNATLSGCMACFITAWSIGYIQLILLSPSETSATLIAITVGAISCCIAEAIPVIPLLGNDNVQIPILTALMVTIVSSM
jgi:dolichol kinase